MKPPIVLCLALVFLVSLIECSKKDTVKPVSERIQQTWTIRAAQENGVTVYTKGAGNNIKPGYAQFRLGLSSPQQQVANLTEVDQATFVGTWTISSDNIKLILSDLRPQPTGTTGVIEYTIESEPSESSLILVRQSQNVKTGNTINRYELIP